MVASPGVVNRRSEGGTLTPQPPSTQCLLPKGSISLSVSRYCPPVDYICSHFVKGQRHDRTRSLADSRRRRP